jgi:hypothetical protein
VTVFIIRPMTNNWFACVSIIRSATPTSMSDCVYSGFAVCGLEAKLHWFVVVYSALLRSGDLGGGSERVTGLQVAVK